MNINTLPDLCLRHIFTQLPLTDLIHLNTVCHQWHSLQPPVLFSKTSLTLLIGEETFSLARANSPLTTCTMENVFLSDFLAEFHLSEQLLKFSEQSFISSEIPFHLIDHLPNIQHLSLITSKYNEPIIRNVTALIENLAPKLKSLHLWLWTGPHAYRFHSTEPEDEYAERSFLPVYADKLLSVINLSLPNVSNLILNLGNFMSPLMDWSILAQLESFYFNSAGTFENVLKQIADYSGPGLRKVGIGRWIDYRNYPEAQNWIEKSRKLVQKVKYLRVDFTLEVKSLFHWFSEIEVLHLHLHQEESFSLVNLAKSLEPLRKLRHVRLNVKYHQGLVPLSKDDHVPSIDIPQLPSIHYLTLDVSTSTHQDLASKHWAWIFPNLKLIRLFHSLNQCEQCSVMSEDNQVKGQCLQELVEASFRGLPSQCLVATNRSGPVRLGDYLYFCG